MNEDILAFQNTTIDKSFIDEIFQFKVKELESIGSITISQYSIALSQYLIYIKSVVNKTRADIVIKERFIDSTVFQLLTDEILKKYRTKKDATAYIISNTEELNKAQEEINKLKKELILIDGIDKTISDYISTFKRELTRRENESWQHRK